MDKDSFLIFIHIPKTAGTSLRHILISSMAKDELIVADPPNPFDHEAALEHIAMKIKESPRARAIIGHFRYGIHEVLPTKKYKYITFVRDPVERMLSEYFHHFEMNGLLGFGESGGYDESMFNYLVNKNLVSHNLQVKFINGNECDKSSIEYINDDFYVMQAIDNINKDFCFIGFSNDLQKAISQLNKVCELSLSTKRINLNARNYPEPREIFYQNELDTLYQLNNMDISFIKKIGIEINPLNFVSMDFEAISYNLLQAQNRSYMIALKNIYLGFKLLEKDRIDAQEIIEHQHRQIVTLTQQEIKECQHSLVSIIKKIIR